MKMIEVVAAVIINDSGKFFCAKRKDEGELALKWEFPGGKIEQGESHEEALLREIREELSVDIEIIKYLRTVKHQYNSFHLTMHAYIAKIIKGNMELTEHPDSKWLSFSELESLDWAAADIQIVEDLIKK